MKKLPRYERLPKHLFWWCNIHQRQATHNLIRQGIPFSPCCNPKLSGIMMPCSADVVNLTGIAEIIK